MNRKMKTLIRNQTIGNQMLNDGMCGTGPSGPPKKSVTTTADIVMTFMNSARKNMAKRIDEYSVWKPPTSSDSASVRSNGGRVSSAVIATRKRTNGTMPRRIRFQSQNPVACDWTIARVDSEPVMRTTVTTVMPSAASYEIICADARTEPSSGYFEPDDQPASMTP